MSLGIAGLSRGGRFVGWRLRRDAERWIAGPRRTWILVLAAAMLPLLLLGGWAGSLSADHTRANTRALARDKVALVAQRITAELHAQIGLAQALAASTALDDGDLSAFRIEVGRFEALHPLWQTVILSTPAGAPQMNMLRPGARVRSPAADPGFETVLLTHEPTVGGIGPADTAPAARLVTLQVPVMRQDALRYILTVAMAPDAIGGILNHAGAPANWVGVVVDASGHILARTSAEHEQLGHLASSSLLDAIAHHAADFHTGTTLEGLQVETVARVLPDTGGWTVAFGIPANTLRQPVRRALALLTAACLVSLALSAALAALVTRDMTQRREDERNRAELALRASEESRVMAVEAAELGTWRWDFGADRFDGSARCRAMLALPPLGTLETWQMAMAAVHPQDQAALAEAVQQCVAAGGGFCSEFKIVRHDGAQTWIRATGRKLAGGAEQPPSVQGVMDDITPRRRGEAERIDLLRRLAQAQEDERRRISRDLHDQIGQTVTGLSLSLKALERDGAMTPSRMTSLQAMVAAISRDIHQAAVALRPSVLDDLGLVRALQALAASSAEASGMRIDVQAVGLTTRLSSEIETVIYRLVQEALTNVMKHAEASAVSILLDRGTEQIRVIVEDDGVGFDVEWRTGRNDTAHLGLSSMRERLALIGGSMTIESARGSGTTLFIQLPVAQHQPEARL